MLHILQHICFAMPGALCGHIWVPSRLTVWENLLSAHAVTAPIGLTGVCLKALKIASEAMGNTPILAGYIINEVFLLFFSIAWLSEIMLYFLCYSPQHSSSRGGDTNVDTRFFASCPGKHSSLLRLQVARQLPSYE